MSVPTGVLAEAVGIEKRSTAREGKGTKERGYEDRSNKKTCGVDRSLVAIQVEAWL